MTDAPRPTPLAVAILNLLEEAPMHPYDMLQVLRRRGEDQWVKVSPGSLYHQVERLVADGLAEVVGTEQEGRRPQRTTYRVTDAGLAALQEWVSSRVARVENAYPCFPLALGQLGSLPPDRARADLLARVVELDAHVTRMTGLIDEARTRDVERLWLLAHEYALHALKAERDFVRGLVTDIDQKELTWPHL